MKYIRTKNGVLFPTNAHEEDIPKDDCFFKVGDTIEELCDLYVTHYKIGEKDYFHDIRVSIESAKWFAEKDHPNFSSFKVRAIYGAIWTDKGLIYVAEMNKEGEFELL